MLFHSTNPQKGECGALRGQLCHGGRGALVSLWELRVLLSSKQPHRQLLSCDILKPATLWLWQTQYYM